MTPRLTLLSLIALVCVWFSFFSEPAPEIVLAKPRTSQASASSLQTDQKPTVAVRQASEEPRLIPELAPERTPRLIPRQRLISSHKVPQTNLFSANLPPASPTIVSPPPAMVNVPAPRPTAPPIDFTYLGKSLADGKWSVFLSRQGQTLIVQEGEMVDSTYRVVRIQPPVLEVLYLPLKETQTIGIGNAD